jgi:wyosine [tRNA(Phe)-imidazoG37] synthetase (radical SAM superfamily)
MCVGRSVSLQHCSHKWGVYCWTEGVSSKSSKHPSFEPVININYSVADEVTIYTLQIIRQRMDVVSNKYLHI